MPASSLTASLLATLLFSVSGVSVGLGLNTVLPEPHPLPTSALSTDATVVSTTTTTAPAPVTTAPSTTPPTTAAPDIGDGAATIEAPVSWTRASDANCHCSAEFPSRPTARNLAVDGASPIHMLSAGGASLSVAVMSQDVQNVAGDDATLRTIADAVAAKAGVTLKDITFGTNGGVRQLSATATDSSSRTRLRAFVQDSRLYVIVVASANTGEVDAAFNRVTSSFRTA